MPRDSFYLVRRHLLRSDHGHGDGACIKVNQQPFHDHTEKLGQRLTTKPPKAIPPLHLRIREPPKAALHGTQTRPVSSDLPSTHSNTRLGSARRGRKRGRGRRRSRRGGGAGTGSRVRVRRGRVAGDGGPGARAGLLDGVGLELGVGLGVGRVDGEDHAAAAVVALAAEEP